GLYEVTPEQRGRRVKPHWLAYLTVADVDATVRTAADRGAVLVRAPRTVRGGRIAVVRDVAGALGGVSRPDEGLGTAAGSGPLRRATRVVLEAPLPGAASAFYHGWLGFRPDGTAGPEGREGLPVAATHPSTGEEPAWVVYFAVPDCVEAVSRAKALGATG